MKLDILKPKTTDIGSLRQLIDSFSTEGLMLPKTEDDLYKQMRGFRVIKDDLGEVIACAHLDLFTEILAEVRSLAVHKNYQGKGLGKLLVKDCEIEAKALGIKKIFALTFQDRFFNKMNYQQVEKDDLPEKVYRECVKCKFYNDCKEIAVLKFL